MTVNDLLRLCTNGAEKPRYRGGLQIKRCCTAAAQSETAKLSLKKQESCYMCLKNAAVFNQNIKVTL